MASLLRRVGAEFTANSTTAGYQWSQQIAPLSGGGFVMAWMDESWDGSGYGITAQRFDADGAKLGGEIHVNNLVFLNQLDPSVAGLASGGFVVTWTGEGNGTSSDIKGRIFDSAGLPLGAEFTVNTADTIDQQASQAIALPGGGFLVHWTDTGAPFGGNDPNVRAQIFDSTGAKVGSEFAVNVTLAGTQGQARGVALEGGGFVIVWTDAQGDQYDVKGQVFGSAGNRVGSEFTVPTSTAGLEASPDVAALTGGGFVVSWQEDNNKAYAQMFDPAGTKVGSELVATNADNSAHSVNVTALASGGFVVGWLSREAPGYFVETARAQMFDPAGNRLGSQFQINDAAVGGGYMDLATLASGRVVASWNTGNYEVQAAVFRAPLIGTPAADVLAGTGVDDGIAGLASDDQLSGGGGNDVLDGGLGADRMTGGADDDIYVVDDSGDETIELAGEGTDGVETDLADYSLQAHVENLTGTRAGAQILRGNALDNVLTGGAAGATFHLGSSGNDVVVGGDWDDLLVIDWQDSISDVVTSPTLLFTFSGASGGYRDGEARSVTFSGLEQVDIATGSGDDVVYLPRGGSSARTGAGDDRVYLGSLLDTADGGSGVDGIEAVYQDVEDPFVWDLSASFQGISGFEYFLYLLAGIDGDIITTTAAAASDHIDGWRGADEITLFNGHDTVSGGFVTDFASDLLRVDWRAYDDHVQMVLWSGGIYGGASGEILGGPDRNVDFETFERFAILTGGGDDWLTGWAMSDVLNAGAGNDTLDGGAGTDMMTGGTGDDIYFVDRASDSAIEFAGEGTDEIRTGLATYSLAILPDIENLTATSAVAHDFRGNSANNAITGGAGNDVLRLYDGGNDKVVAGGGNDNIFFIGTLTSADAVDGGAGVDTLVLQGPYGSLTLTANVTLIENVSILGGSNTNFGEPGTNRHDYVLTTNDANFAAGVQARINGAALLEGEDFTFNGSAETNASFVVYGGKGKDTLTGGLGNDIFFYAEERFASGDTVNGGAGYDGMFLRGNYIIDFNAPGYTGLFSSIENLTLTSATDERYARGGGTEFDYNLILSNVLVGAGQTLTVSGALLTANETMTLNGSQETDGFLRLFGGAANDTLIGGANADLIHGGLGADEIQGGGGADAFRYQSTAESSGAAGATDRILDFAVGTDKIELDRIDANVNAAGNQAFTWIGSSAFTGVAGQLRAYESGPFWMVEGDTNGDSLADLVIALDKLGPTPLGAGDFLL